MHPVHCKLQTDPDGRAISPILKGYVTSGGFSVRQKLWLSLKDNFIMYSIMGLVGIAAIIFIAVTQNMDMYVERRGVGEHI